VGTGSPKNMQSGRRISERTGALCRVGLLHCADKKYRILQKVMPVRKIRYFYVCVYSTVTDLARLRGWSTSFPLHTAIW
jgi:hypothetical protein